MKQSVHVRAVIKQDGKVLLLRRATGVEVHLGKFELPGGKVGFGEDPRASLQREVSEETGREVETIQLFDVHSELDVRDEQHQYIILVFLATLKPETSITLSEEHDKYVWKKMSDIQLDEVTETTRLALQLEKNGDAPELLHKPGGHNVDNNSTKHEAVIIYADGGSRGNPGPSASGFVVMDVEEKMIFEGGKYLGITTNNQAEYQAVKLGLEKAWEMQVKEVSFRLDSQLVVNQLTGIYQIRNRDLWPIHAAIKELAKQFKKVTFTHVRREFNKEADAMVNKILDAQAKA